VTNAMPEGGRVQLVAEGAVGFIVIDNPPVNAGSAAVRAGLVAAIAALNQNDALKAGVLIGAGKTFISGSDIREFGKPLQPPLVPDVVAAIEASPKPIVAAISGAGLGGGYEIALACDARVASPEAVVGLPEVRLGLIPGAGGTQRLPRLIGLVAAVEVICSSRRIAAPEALTLGMIDAVVTDLRREAGAYAVALTGKKRLRDSNVPPFDATDYDAAKRSAVKGARGLASVSHALRAVDLSVTHPIDEALREERAIFDDIRTGEEASALRHLFFAERQSAKFDTDAQPKRLASIGVIGAGAMGSGIAVAALSAGYPVVLVDPDEGARVRAAAFIAKERRSEAALILSGEVVAAAQCDLIIEAIIEDMDAKAALLAELARCAPQAILASNTSYLDLDIMSAALPRPERLVGLHFFNPAHRMKLLEVVKAAATAPDVLATALAFGRRLGKACVIAAVGEGFIGNRIYNAYRRHCEFLVEDGASPAQVDATLKDFGFAMGPFAVGDMSGLDIAWRMRKRLAATRDPRERYVTIPDRLCEAGRLGRKTGQGWYIYDAAAPAGRPDPAVDEIIETCARDTGRVRRPISNEEIIQRALGAIVNEAGLVLSERIARSKADIDLVLVNGYGFPACKGGPLFWAERQGNIERLIDAAAQAYGFGFRRCPDLTVLSATALLKG
jgi:3-hydroxyacyl-CoA dehydrogenase